MNGARITSVQPGEAGRFMRDRGGDIDSLPYRGPLFIVGMPRSGTKLLRELLGNHARIRIPRVETEFFPEMVRYVAGRGGRLDDKRAFREFYEWVRRFPYFWYTERQGRLLSAEDWFNSAVERTAAGLFEALVRHDAEAGRNTDLIWGDKSPSYVTKLDVISGHFQQARFIHIVRDARDQALSARRAWGKDVLRAAQRWNDDVREGLRQGRALGSRFCMIRYEDLTADPAGVLKGLCQFLDVPFDVRMLELHHAPENLGTTKGVHVIVAGNVGQFRTGLAADELARIEDIAGPMLGELGYEVRGDLRPRRLSRASMRLRQAKDYLALVRQRAATEGLLGSLGFHFRYWQATSNHRRR